MVKHGSEGGGVRAQSWPPQVAQGHLAHQVFQAYAKTKADEPGLVYRGDAL